jgi:predicted ATPase
LERLLQRPNCRLITLVGPGGTGKTRLAVEAAARADHFANGAAFVVLAPIRRAEEILPAMVDALGITLYGNTAPAMELRDLCWLLVSSGFVFLLG